MFIEITTPANPLRIENTLRPFKRREKEFTPEVAQQILASTNNPKNIRDMLQLIAGQPVDKQAAYKDVILAVFDHREQPDDTVILGKKLAVANGFENELNNILNHDFTKDTKDGVAYASATNQIAAYITAEKQPDISQYPENINLICTNNEVDLSYTNLSPVKSLKFKEGAKVDLQYCQNLPADLDISMCDEVGLTGTDLSQTETIIFKNKQQRDQYRTILDGWKGKIVYAEEVPPKLTHIANKILFRKKLFTR